MRITRIQVPHFRVLHDVDILFETALSPQVFPLGSQNGGGKSTLLQTVFTLIHCFREPDKYRYIKNLIGGSKFEVSDSSILLFCKIFFSDKDRDFELEFSICESIEYLSDREEEENLTISFSELGKAKSFDKKLNQFKDVFSCLEKSKIKLANIPSRVKKSEKNNVVTSIYNDLLECLENPEERTQLKQIYLNIRRDSSTTLDLRRFIEKMRRSFQQKQDELQDEHLANQGNVEILQGWLEENESRYLCSFNQKYDSVASTSLSLIYSVASDGELDCDIVLDRLSKMIYLAAPSTNIFLLLSKQTKQSVFKTPSARGGLADYYSDLTSLKKNCGNLFTYDFFATELLIEIFQDARDKDFRHAVELGEYGNNYKRVINEINKLLENKIIRVSPDLTGISFLSSTEGKKAVELVPEDLSHGELKRLSIYMWLKYYVSESSIVLMDEVEIALHPDWQYQIVNDLVEWGPSNQYILATHSYELCEALTPVHVKELEPRLKPKESNIA